MIVIEHSIEINSTAEKVYACLLDIFGSSENYHSWHPDHRDIRWIRGKPFENGSIGYAEQYLHGELHRGKFICTNVVPNSYIEYRPVFPASIFIPKLQFIFEMKDNDACIFTARNYLRAGPLFAKLAKQQIADTKRHISEEGENLKAMVEGQK